jgi:hypothetical protein
MKFIQSFQIFESIQSYNFNQVDTYYFTFSDEFGNEFLVEFEKLPDNEVELRYFVKEGDKWSYKEVKTNIWRLTHTIMGQILNSFISQNDWIETIKIVGLGKDTEKDAITQRTKLYWRFFQNNTPEGFELDKYGNEIYLHKI